jgi:hypothetical protein
MDVDDLAAFTHALEVSPILLLLPPDSPSVAPRSPGLLEQRRAAEILWSSITGSGLGGLAGWDHR